jgi:signal transduction histidine kinase
MERPADERQALLGIIGLGIAHELSSPLTSSLLALGLLTERLRGAEPPAPGAVAHELDRVVGHLRRMSDLVDHLRDLATGDTSRRREVLALDDLADRALRLLDATPRDRAEVRIVRGARDPEAVAAVDGLLVEQAVATLMLNAAEALGPGPGTVEVVARRVGDQAIVEVLDDGPGFADPEAARQPGYSTKGAGRGIGLALAEAIVNASAGTLEVGNRPEGGGRVALEFPAAPR